jgi:PTH1 family peptidyl-tRNA hydrolase
MQLRPPRPSDAPAVLALIVARDIADLGTPDFTRVRIGVGKPGHKNVAGHVLDDFAKSEQEELKILIQEAADAVEEILRKGALLAMNKVNVRRAPAE